VTWVIVHAGYHKTGTTSLQDFLRDNRAQLAPVLTAYGKADFHDAGSYARIYAQRPFPWRLWRFRRALRRFLARIPDSRVIVLSRETFSGGMPGHRTWRGSLMTSYHRPARALARVIIDELRRRFGQSVDITFFYTTRPTEPWIASVYGHLLRSIRLTDDFAAFRARLPDLAGPSEEAARMAAALAPVPVVTAALEDYADHREGPAAALLDHIGVPRHIRARLRPARHSNHGQNDRMRGAFLDLNRSLRNKSELRRRKEALMANPPEPSE